MATRKITNEEKINIEKIIDYFNSDKMQEVIYTNIFNFPDISSIKKQIKIKENLLTIVKQKYTPIFYLYLNENSCGFDDEEIQLENNNLLNEIVDLIENNIVMNTTYVISQSN